MVKTSTKQFLPIWGVHKDLNASEWKIYDEPSEDSQKGTSKELMNIWGERQ